MELIEIPSKCPYCSYGNTKEVDFVDIKSHYVIQECKKCTLLYKVEYEFKPKIKVIKK